MYAFEFNIYTIVHNVFGVGCHNSTAAWKKTEDASSEDWRTLNLRTFPQNIEEMYMYY